MNCSLNIQFHFIFEFTSKHSKNNSGRNTFCLNVTPFPLSSFLNVHIWTCKKVCNNFCFCRPLSQNFLKLGTIHFSIIKLVTFLLSFSQLYPYTCTNQAGARSYLYTPLLILVPNDFRVFQAALTSRNTRRSKNENGKK